MKYIQTILLLLLTGLLVFIGYLYKKQYDIIKILVDSHRELEMWLQKERKGK